MSLALKEHDNPLLVSGGRRLKQPGSTPGARSCQECQRTRQDATPLPRPDVDAFLARLHQAEQGTQHFR